MDDVAALIDWLDVPEVDLLGYSIGGGLALDVARAYPARIRCVVAQAPVFDLHDPAIVESQLTGLTRVAQGDVAAAIRQLSAPTSAKLLEAIWAVVDEATVDRFLFQHPQHARRNRAGWIDSGLVNTGALAATLKRQAPSDTPAHLSDLRLPILVVWGRHDQNVPRTSCEPTFALLTPCRFLTLPSSCEPPWSMRWSLSSGGAGHPAARLQLHRSCSE
ncbi:alpha/beta hydrolase (plasmid) [Deinococcus sp. KNUC1210]|nr:alpha/beta hydrolase [Deinococcus sp. KNUC1210]